MKSNSICYKCGTEQSLALLNRYKPFTRNGLDISSEIEHQLPNLYIANIISKAGNYIPVFIETKNQLRSFYFGRPVCRNKNGLNIK
jgi:hypothetical protein